MSVLSRIQWYDRLIDGVVRYLSDARTRVTAWATDGARTNLPDGESLIPMADQEHGGAVAGGGAFGGRKPQQIV